MHIDSYDSLLHAAKRQVQPQRLLFAFARAELPFGASAEQKHHFDQGRGGTLTPVMCVDKLPHEVASFGALENESRQTGQDWDVVFVACLDGHGGLPPASNQAEGPLRSMIAAIQAGSLGRFLAFDRAGTLLSLN